MNSNPLQQYFRQPKIYIKMPSNGIFNKLGSVQGDVSNMPVYGMTGMDEIILKTPDALLSGESTVRVIESCCPVIKDAWETRLIDVPAILAAIRIATYGNELPVTSTCPHCGTENEYDMDVSKIIEFYNTRKFDSALQVGGLVVKLQPLTYKQSTAYNLRNFKLQQTLNQAELMPDGPEKQKVFNEIFEELGTIQNDIYLDSIDSVETADKVVTEKQFISEWIKNCDSDIFDAIKKRIDQTRQYWAMPPTHAVCSNPECGKEVNVTLELDQSNFFVRA